ncbi:hypothetical protein DRN73_07105 [Candidatus Pacearchaeota archaeon]|nr:MAG: hypothetical protein DRN73_07105 [Candidatus Pacearchaeota archaeon]
MIKSDLGKYRIIDWIGGGQFADVFLAEDKILKRKVALKIPRIRPENIDFFIQEAILLAKLDHPNIVKLYTAEIIDDRIIMVMEYVEGDSLRAMLNEKKKISWRDAYPYIFQMLEAIDYAHKMGILHRDIKPENILITREGKVKLMDFGLAKLLEREKLSTSIAGTPIYMAPEAWKGEFFKESDIWSLGCVIYEMLAGYPPFYADNFDDLRNAIFHEKFKPIEGIPHRINQILKKMLEKDREKRYHSVSQVYNEFKNIFKDSQKELPLRSFEISSKIDKGIFSFLSDEQYEVIKNSGNFSLITGPAGSGKTTLLLYKIVYIIEEEKIPPESILVLVFTKKAVEDLKSKLQKLIGESKVFKIWISTTHHFCVNILSREIHKIGYSKSFQVISPYQKLEILKNIVNQKLSVKEIAEEISLLKANLYLPDDLNLSHRDKWGKTLKKIYSQYQSYLKHNNLLDYDDLILLTVKIFEEFPESVEYYGKKFKRILVDEFQDFNYAQYKLIKYLANSSGYLFACGDYDQSIYGFRGASPEFLEKFLQDFKDAKRFELKYNYRTPRQIVELAQTLLKHNKVYKTNLVVPLLDREDAVEVYSFDNEYEEANFIVQKIKEYRSRGKDWEDIAIFSRTHSRLLTIEEILQREEIPFNVVGKSGFYERTEIKSLIVFLCLLLKLPVPKEYIKVFLRKFFGFEVEETKYALRGSFKNGKFAISSKLSPEKQMLLVKLNQFLEKLREKIEITSPSVFLDEFLEFSGYKNKLIKAKDIKELIEKENIEEFIYRAGSFSNVRDFLNHIALMQNLEIYSDSAGVKVMTVHSAKGLEFPIVFLSGMVEGIFPIQGSKLSDKELEEERRLCYVAITRAQEKLFITYPRKIRGIPFLPSVFLYEMHVIER